MMRSAPPAAAAAVLASACLLVTLSGCASRGPTGPDGLSAPRIETTRITTTDLDAMTDAMVESMLAADALEPGMVVVADRVVNLTDHIIPDHEKRLFVADLRRKLLADRRLDPLGVTFVAGVADAPDAGAHDAIGAGPDAALAATFRTLGRTERTVRDDYHDCEFRLVDLRTNEVRWVDAYPVRIAVPRGRHE